MYGIPPATFAATYPGALPWGYSTSMPAYMGQEATVLMNAPSYLGEVGDDGAALPPEVASAVAIAAQFAEARANSPEELSARIANLQALQQQFPIAKNAIARRISRLEGRRQALLRDRAATQQWRSLGQTGLGVGILLGFALVGLTLSTALRK